MTDLFQLLSSRTFKFLVIVPPVSISKKCTPVGIFPFQPWMHVGFFTFRSWPLEKECCREVRARTGSQSGLLKYTWKPLVCLLKLLSLRTCNENVFLSTVFYTGCSPLLLTPIRPIACSSFTICVRWNFKGKVPSVNTVTTTYRH